jgi:hypothetical protein
MAERVRALRTHCKKSAKHLPLPAIYDAYEILHILTLLSTLAPLRVDAGRCTVASRLGASLSAMGFVVKGLQDGPLPRRPAF